MPEKDFFVGADRRVAEFHTLTQSITSLSLAIVGGVATVANAISMAVGMAKGVVPPQPTYSIVEPLRSNNTKAGIEPDPSLFPSMPPTPDELTQRQQRLEQLRDLHKSLEDSWRVLQQIKPTLPATQDDKAKQLVSVEDL